MSRPASLEFHSSLMIPSVCLALSLLCARAVEAGDVELKRIASRTLSGFSEAVLIESRPLIHTGQFFARDTRGHAVAKGDASRQMEWVADQMLGAVRQAGGEDATVVRVHLVAANLDACQHGMRVLARRWSPGAAPALSMAVGALADPDSLVGLDAIAVPLAKAGPSARQFRAVEGATSVASAAMLPSGPAVFVAGQAEPGSLEVATRKTLASLERTLGHLGLGRTDVVQLKAFMSPMNQAEAVRRLVREYFHPQLAPPLVLVEWLSNLPIEIEIVASAPKQSSTAQSPVEFITPPWMSASPVFSRVAVVHGARRIYTSSLVGESGVEAGRQVESMFDSLRHVLEPWRSDFQHLIKATYFVSLPEVSAKLNELRPRYYDPRRPPSASKAMVPGIGLPGASISMDMIAVVP